MRTKRNVRLRNLVSAKLGRCPRCIRASIIGTVAGWILVAAANAWANPLALYLVLPIAAAFTLVFVAHVVAIGAREVAARRRFRRVKESFGRPAPSSPQRRQFFGSTLKIGAAAAATFFVDLTAGARVASADITRLFKLFLKIRLCNCYYSSNCSSTGRGTKCLWTWNGAVCLWRPKPATMINGVHICGENPGDPQCDGLCTGLIIRHIDWNRVIAIDVAEAADLYFQAYLAAGRSGGGPPDRSFVERAAALRLPMNWHLELIDAVHRSLNVTLGWDFMPCTFDETCFGQVPRLSEDAAALIDAAREGFVAGLRDNDPRAVEAPIRDFWSRTESYEPMHSGRCYPHGHPDAPDAATCQVEELKADLALLLAGRVPRRA